MDGVLTRDEYLKDYPKDYDGTIPKVTYETSFDQVKVAKVNAEGCISFCINSIKDRPIYLIYPKGTTGVLPVAPLNYWELYLIARPFSKTNKGAPCYFAGASFEIIHLLRVGFNLSFDLI